MRAKWKNSTCLKCGADEWAVGVPEELLTMLPIGSGGEDNLLQTKHAMTLAWLVCRSCGYTEFVLGRAVQITKEYAGKS